MYIFNQIVLFSWADTTSVRTSMPGFFSLMQSQLRNTSEGADTMVWLSMDGDVGEDVKAENGTFWEDRQAVSKHLKFTTHERSQEKIELLVMEMDKMHATAHLSHGVV